MLHIVLLILKIIGIILLVLLLLVLALILIVLCTPVRYRLQGAYADDKPDIHARVGIWFSLIAVNLTFDEEGLAVFLKIFGMRKNIIEPKPKSEEPDAEEYEPIEIDFENESEPENEDDKEDDEISFGLEPEDDFAEEGDSLTEVEDEAEERYFCENDSEKSQSDEEIPVDDISPEDGETEEEEKTDFKERIMSIVDKVKGIYYKLSERIEKLKSLYESIKRREEAVMWFLKEGSTKHTLAVLKKQLAKVMKSILPKKVTGDLTLGLDDPGTMGQICMYAGMFYPMYEKRFKFTPVFTEKVIDGEVNVKGRIILGAILCHMARILLVPDFYRTLKNVRILMRKMK